MLPGNGQLRLLRSFRDAAPGIGQYRILDRALCWSSLQNLDE
jgi:hypothetical protein